MKVLNIHKRIGKQSKQELGKLLSLLSSNNDQIWPYENWPRMRFKKGLIVGAKGGHEPIRYTIEKYIENEVIEFRFTKPKGFNGTHRFDITALKSGQTELRHTIVVSVKGWAALNWFFIIKPLHNALLCDALDKTDRYFNQNSSKTKWSIWVKILRRLLK